jgi:nucleotide-binding universal stress UspA family protein
MRIIIPTDFSDNAQRAFEFAYAAHGPEAEYILLNSYETPNAGSGGMLVSIDEILQKESLNDLKLESKKLLSNNPELKLETESIHGSIEDGIHRVHYKKACDLVYIGTTGASGLKEVLIGSNAERVIREALLPVIAIPSECEYAPINKIVFASDLKENHSEETFRPLLNIARIYGAKVDIIHVHGTNELTEEESSQKEYIESQLKEVFGEFKMIVSGQIVPGIHDYINDNQVDLLTLIPRKVSFFQRLFKQSVSKDMAYHVSVPLLTLKDRD